jgi:hypothetical protein
MSELGESRSPSLEDLIDLCRKLNEAEAHYVIVGGMAMLQLGFVRATEDIALLVEPSLSNEKKVIEAVSRLPDHAASEIQPGEISQYEVIRVADEIVVDLMSKACGVDYHGASAQIIWVERQGVRMPFASRELMIRLKQSVREKDRLDLQFLKTMRDT